jgi:hypothetical protein
MGTKVIVIDSLSETSVCKSNNIKYKLFSCQTNLLNNSMLLDLSWKVDSYVAGQDI